MSEERDPFEDVIPAPGGFSIPDLKWRELLFIGALRPEGAFFVRDPLRPMPPFRMPGLFPEGVRYEVTRMDGRVRLKRL
jgi:hypothetical protein